MCPTTLLSAREARLWWSTAGPRIVVGPGPGRVRGDPPGMRPGRVEYRLVGALDPIATVNLRWLAGYRHPRYGIPALAGALRAAFAAPVPLMDGAEAVGNPVAVLPMLYHLLWRQELAADLSVPLHPATVVALAAA